MIVLDLAVVQPAIWFKYGVRRLVAAWTERRRLVAAWTERRRRVAALHKRTELG